VSAAPLTGTGLRTRLLAGAALIVCAPWLAGQAAAQTAPAPASRPAAATADSQAPGPDGLPPNAVYIQAERATQANDVITASGTVERVFARFQGHTLRAGEVTYDLASAASAAPIGRSS
jgi:LPS-assembly protein